MVNEEVFFKITKDRCVYEPGSLIPLYMPCQSGTLGAPRVSSLVFVFNCTSTCCLSVYPSLVDTCALFLNLNVYLTNKDGLISRTLPCLFRNVLIKVVEPAAFTSRAPFVPPGSNSSSADQSDTKPARRASKRVASLSMR